MEPFLGSKKSNLHKKHRYIGNFMYMHICVLFSIFCILYSAFCTVCLSFGVHVLLQLCRYGMRMGEGSPPPPPTPLCFAATVTVFAWVWGWGGTK
jgi:hypothetical protein